MEAEPSPGVSPSSLNFPFHQGDFGSFGDLFSQSQSQSHQSHTPPPSSSNHDPYSQHPSPVAPLNQLSPGQQNFADLLAEFTLPGNAMSPQTGESAAEQATGGGGGGYSNAPSPQQQFELSNEVSSQFQQFIAASLASGASNPQQAPIAQKQHFSTPQPLYASHQSSPAASSQTQSLPGSHAPSPMPTYSTSTPTSSMYHAAPTAAPYVVVPNPYSIGPQQYSIPAQQAQLFAQQFAMLQSQGQQQMANVLAQAQAIVQANHLAQQQQQFQHQQRQQQSAGSQSTSADGGEWRENEFVFSPLMSPAMTPGSVFTAASSLPPSTGPLPMSTPSDFFPPLTSPALGPQMYSTDHQHPAQRNSLQGLVDGVGALSTQLPPGAGSASPHAFLPYQSPRMHAHDAGSHTAAGSGRRGASTTNKKARPSPLIKASDPTLDPNRRKRRTTQSNGNGNRSATASPYMSATNPTVGKSQGGTGGSSTPGTFSAGSSAGGASQKTSPIEFGSGIDTPSPVDLATSASKMTTFGLEGLPIPPPSFSTASSSQPPYQLEPMGPPPPPSHSFSHAAHQSAQPLSTSVASSSSSSTGSFNPITPATIMNFSSDFDISTLSSLSPALGPTHPTTTGSSDPTFNGGSVQSSPALLSQLDSTLPPVPEPEGGRERASQGGEAKVSSSIGKAKSLRKSVKASPALRAVDAKGKGKVEGGGRKSSVGSATKQAKIAPSPKVGPNAAKIQSSIAVDAPPEPHSRFAGQDGHEGDLAVDALALSMAGPPPTAENRKSTHKLAEQKRRDSLKLCFDELRQLLPPIMPFVDDGNRRPGEGNVGGQRNGEMDPENPNKGVSKVALLRRSNEYLEILRERIERRDRAISALRRQNEQLKSRRPEKDRPGSLGATSGDGSVDASRASQATGDGDDAGDGSGDDGEDGFDNDDEDDDEIPGLDLDLDNIDGGERAAGNLAFYEDLDFESKFASLAHEAKATSTSRRTSTSSRRASVNSSSTAKPTRRSTRNASSQSASNEAMEVEG